MGWQGNREASFPRGVFPIETMGDTYRATMFGDDSPALGKSESKSTARFATAIKWIEKMAAGLF